MHILLAELLIAFSEVLELDPLLPSGTDTAGSFDAVSQVCLSLLAVLIVRLLHVLK